MTPLLSLSGVAAGYGAAQVLWDNDLQFAPGNVTALMGCNGVGKTTLLRTIIGIQPLDAGRCVAGQGCCCSTNRPRACSPISSR